MHRYALACLAVHPTYPELDELRELAERCLAAAAAGHPVELPTLPYWRPRYGRRGDHRCDDEHGVIRSFGRDAYSQGLEITERNEPDG